MNYTINFDFGKHWKTAIVQYLDNPELLKSVRDGVNNYLLIVLAKNKKYKKGTPPAMYSSDDHYSNLMERKQLDFIHQLVKENKMPTNYLQLVEKVGRIDELDDKSGKIDKLFGRMVRLETRILKEFMTWDVMRYDLESYYLSGGSHVWAPTFELTLARLVEPNEEWTLRSGKLHTTVINESGTKVFDLLYWARGRIENYMFAIS